MHTIVFPCFENIFIIFDKVVNQGQEACQMQE